MLRAMRSGSNVVQLAANIDGGSAGRLSPRTARSANHEPRCSIDGIT